MKSAPYKTIPSPVASIAVMLKSSNKSENSLGVRQNKSVDTSGVASGAGSKKDYRVQRHAILELLDHRSE
jgi:hypothetical protein